MTDTVLSATDYTCTRYRKAIISGRKQYFAVIEKLGLPPKLIWPTKTATAALAKGKLRATRMNEVVHAGRELRTLRGE